MHQVPAGGSPSHCHSSTWCRESWRAEGPQCRSVRHSRSCATRRVWSRRHSDVAQCRHVAPTLTRCQHASRSDTASLVVGFRADNSASATAPRLMCSSACYEYSHCCISDSSSLYVFICMSWIFTASISDSSSLYVFICMSWIFTASISDSSSLNVFICISWIFTMLYL